jgi:hypothetical protein
MTQPYHYTDVTVRYMPLPDESALLVRRTQRRQGISTTSGKSRSIYGALKTPLADDLVMSLYRIHAAERCSTCSL